MTYNKLRGIAAGVLMAAAATVALTSCSGTALGELGENQQILTTCPPDTKLASLVFVDGTTSGLTDASVQEDLAVIELVARRTAVCGGRLTVAAFSASSGSTVPIFDQAITLPGATDNARLRRVPDAVTEIMEHITASHGDAIAAVPGGGTDVVGLYRLAGEHQKQLGDGYQLNLIIRTDGLNNLGVNTERALSEDEAIALADQVVVPTLPGASIHVSGLGRVAGTPLPSTVIDGLVTFYDRLCENTSAASCTIVTDYAGR